MVEGEVRRRRGQVWVRRRVYLCRRPVMIRFADLLKSDGLSNAVETDGRAEDGTSGNLRRRGLEFPPCSSRLLLRFSYRRARLALSKGTFIPLPSRKSQTSAETWQKGALSRA